jgi:NAD(P)H-dependent FMN reductase
MTTYTVGYFVGSLASNSINRMLSRALIRLAPPDLQFVEIPIKDLPLYNRDFDADYPPEGRALKDAIASVDAVLFVTPEYNRGIPGSLKNAIDWASRPWGTNSFEHRCFAGQNRHCRRATEPAQRSELLQLTADGRTRGLHPVHAGLGDRRWRSHRQDN